MKIFKKSRRDFLKFSGAFFSTILFSSCSKFISSNKYSQKINSLPPGRADDLKLIPNLSYKLLIGYNEPLDTKGNFFGYNNDFTAFIPLDDKNPHEGFLWVNHEYPTPFLVCGHSILGNKNFKTKEQVDIEMKTVGGSLLHVKFHNNAWKVVFDSKHNQRYDALTPIPFSPETSILGKPYAIGTISNCSGGVTPWKTFLTCEENYQDHYGDVQFNSKGDRSLIPAKWNYGWDHLISFPPEHYGWVVEINPFTKAIKKLISLGRFCHEGAAVTCAKNGNVVVYMGDDANDECFYKFVSSASDSLDHGTLYVANISQGVWIPLTLENPLLKNKFKDEVELKIRTREAAKIVGGTLLDRPEGCAIHPHTGHIYFSCTNNLPKNRPYGSIYKIVEKNNDHGSLEFTPSIFIAGGQESTIACPDNLIFDRDGDLWVTNDVSEEKSLTDTYQSFGNNSLFFIPMKGTNAGKAFRVAQGPIDSELTGPSFSPDGKTLFLSVQHPGSRTTDLRTPTSHWPDGGSSIPRPAVVAISLEKFDKNL